MLFRRRPGSQIIDHPHPVLVCIWLNKEPHPEVVNRLDAHRGDRDAIHTVGIRLQ